MIPVQVGSADVVGAVLGGKNLDRVLEAIGTPAKPLTPNERAAVHSISFDTLRHYGLLSSQLELLLSTPLNDAPVRNLLLVALAQLQFSKASAHAIVDHAVTAVETLGFPRAKPLVNAVLRNYLRAPEKFKRERFKTDLARYDFPRWWTDRLKREQPEHWEAILLSASDHPPMGLRVNARKTTVDAYLARLASAGISAEPRGGMAIELVKPMSVNELPGFRDGWVSVQDEGAQLAAVFLDAQPGMRVLDACAAPGGKAGHILERSDVELVALDSDRFRLKRVAENLERLGLKAKLQCANAADLGAWWDKRTFDRILVDVPCSGSGVTRRHPDIKWLRRETDLGSFARQQQRLLESLWNCLSVGGRLLYVTCSVFRPENQEIVAQFLQREQNARSLPLSVGFAQNGAGMVNAVAQELEDGQLFPNDHHDGFFYALLEKTG
jgi:16S rRNA (cytosine967-C5)-methyltransferase